MRITGVGGTGVVTIAQILGTAFAADGRQVRSLDQTGLAQKGGAVVSDLSISAGGRAERSAKLGYGECDLYLGCDSLVATDGTQLRAASKDRTVAVVSTTEVPTGQMVADVSAHFPAVRPGHGRDRGEGALGPLPRRGGAGHGAVRRRAVRQHDPGGRRLPGGRAAGQRGGARARHQAQRRRGGRQHPGVPARPAGRSTDPVARQPTGPEAPVEPSRASRT